MNSIFCGEAGMRSCRLEAETNTAMPCPGFSDGFLRMQNGRGDEGPGGRSGGSPDDQDSRNETASRRRNRGRFDLFDTAASIRAALQQETDLVWENTRSVQPLSDMLPGLRRTRAVAGACVNACSITARRTRHCAVVRPCSGARRWTGAHFAHESADATGLASDAIQQSGPSATGRKHGPDEWSASVKRSGGEAGARAFGAREPKKNPGQGRGFRFRKQSRQ